MTFERYKDKYGARIALPKIPFNVSQELKAHMGWPQSSWNGAKGLWTIQDKPEVVEKALAFLAQHDIQVDSPMVVPTQLQGHQLSHERRGSRKREMEWDK